MTAVLPVVCVRDVCGVCGVWDVCERSVGCVYAVFGMYVGCVCGVWDVCVCVWGVSDV